MASSGGRAGRISGALLCEGDRPIGGPAAGAPSSLLGLSLPTTSTSTSTRRCQRPFYEASSPAYSPYPPSAAKSTFKQPVRVERTLGHLRIGRLGCGACIDVDALSCSLRLLKASSSGRRRSRLLASDLRATLPLRGNTVGMRVERWSGEERGSAGYRCGDDERREIRGEEVAALAGSGQPREASTTLLRDASFVPTRSPCRVADVLGGSIQFNSIFH
ncbi:hypothetical protein B0H13DRAFT_2073278 [Mycena leptocephala]|nr:hypothetical protein B0H13DRAFT_2073278 [Mycena leptocephala]